MFHSAWGAWDASVLLHCLVIINGPIAQLLFIAVGFYLLAALAKGTPALLPVCGVVLAMGFYVIVVSVVALIGVFRKSVRLLAAYIFLLISAVALMCYAIAVFMAKVVSGESMRIDHDLFLLRSRDLLLHHLRSGGLRQRAI